MKKTWVSRETPPYTRGIYPTMYRGKLWTLRQFSGYGTAEDTNRRFQYLLSQGQTGLSVAFDLPTLMGMDSDHPMSEGEVGKCGVAVASFADMEVLFDGIDLEKDNHLDDDQFSSGHHLGDVPGQRGEERVRLEEDLRHNSK